MDGQNFKANKIHYDGPVVLVILDGVGLAPDGPGNAVSKARTSFLGQAVRDYPHVALEASGEAVGLLPGQMGNSEVGHNTIGAGQIYKQGIAKIEEAFKTGEIFETPAWKGAITQVLKDDVLNAANRDELDKNDDVWYNEEIEPAHTLHFAGIFSDGGVHSHISHLEQMVAQAYAEGVRRIRVHAIFDGRDVMPTAEPKYIRRFEEFAARFNDADIKIASGGGRMTTVSDRYESDWGMVKRGFDMMVRGEAAYYFQSAEEGVEMLRRLVPDVQDQDLPAFVIEDDKGPIGKIEKGDSLIYFDFRADRAIEIAQAFTYYDFPYFDRGDYKPDDVYFVGMTEYNSDTHVPEHRLVEPIEIRETLHEFLGERGISQLAVTETVKFGHLTYYFNGNSYDKVAGEEFIEIESYPDPFDEKPWMREAEITDAVLENLNKYKFVRINYPAGDMVGHTANMEATIVAMEATDICLKRLAKKVDELHGVLIIMADHGNAEELIDENGEPKTSHTTNKIPCVFYDNTENREKYQLADVKNPGLSNIAATVAKLLGQEDYPSSWNESLVK